MRKVTLFALIVTVVVNFTCLCAFAADNYSKFSSKFKKNFKDCDKYEETITSEFEGSQFTTTRKIKGWRNSFCQYEESVISTNGSYLLTCGFSSVQVDELYDAMKSRSKEISRHELELFAEQKDPRTGKIKYVKSGTTTIKGDKAYIAWAKYQNNPYFCKPQKIK